MLPGLAHLFEMFPTAGTMFPAPPGPGAMERLNCFEPVAPIESITGWDVVANAMSHTGVSGPISLSNSNILLWGYPPSPGEFVNGLACSSQDLHRSILVGAFWAGKNRLTRAPILDALRRVEILLTTSRILQTSSYGSGGPHTSVPRTRRGRGAADSSSLDPHCW